MTGRGSTCEGLPLQDREKAVGPSISLGPTAFLSVLPGPEGLADRGREDHFPENAGLRFSVNASTASSKSADFEHR